MNQLEIALSLLLNLDPFALRVITGEFEPPDGEEIMAAKEEAKRPGACNESFLAADFDSAIERAGGWPRITAGAREYILRFPRKWKMIVEYYVWVKPNKSRIDGSIRDKVARENGVSAATLWRTAKAFPAELARAVYFSEMVDAKK